MNPIRQQSTTLLLALLLVIWTTTPLWAQSYTLTPTPFQTALDNSGKAINNGCVWTYNAGTTTPATTFLDNAGTPNTNPIRSDSAGRFTAYLQTMQSYKFVYEGPCTPPAHGATLRTADNVSAVPTNAATLDVTGIAGETINAGLCAYLSDGSGGKVAGDWYKCDVGNAYSSTLPEVGIAPSTITSGTTGTIRLSGTLPGLSALVIGSTYYVGTNGALTLTAPAFARPLGVADTISSLVMQAAAVPLQAWADDFRLSLTTGTCVTTADVTAATTLYLTPCNGNRIDLPTSTGAPMRVTSAEVSIAIPATTSQMYDVFGYLNGSTVTLELLAWTNDTTRATAIVRTNGRYMKSGDSTRLYLGSVRTTTVSGQTEDSFAKRYLWNYYNRVTRPMRVLESTLNWSYTTATWRQTNAAATNQLDCVIGIADSQVHVEATSFFSNSTAGTRAFISIGLDSTTTPMSTVRGVVGVSASNGGAGGVITQIPAVVDDFPAVGRHTYVWLEQSEATGTATWYGKQATTPFYQAGITGWLQG